MSALVADFTVNKKEMKEAAQSPDASILDITEWLIVNLKHSYNQAYGIAEKIVIYAQKSNTKLSLLELSELKGIESKINKDIYSVLIPSRALISRRSAGGTNPVQLRKAIRAAKRKHI